MATRSGTVLLSTLIFLLPPLYGEGYGSIVALLSGNISSIVDGSIFYSDRDNVWFILLFIGMIIMAKAFAIGHHRSRRHRRAHSRHRST